MILHDGVDVLFSPQYIRSNLWDGWKEEKKKERERESVGARDKGDKVE